jgi:hypothetical protein
MAKNASKRAVQVLRKDIQVDLPRSRPPLLRGVRPLMEQ